MQVRVGHRHEQLALGAHDRSRQPDWGVGERAPAKESRLELLAPARSIDARPEPMEFAVIDLRSSVKSGSKCNRLTSDPQLAQAPFRSEYGRRSTCLALPQSWASMSTASIDAPAMLNVSDGLALRQFLQKFPRRHSWSGMTYPDRLVGSGTSAVHCAFSVRSITP